MGTPIRFKVYIYIYIPLVKNIPQIIIGTLIRDLRYKFFSQGILGSSPKPKEATGLLRRSACPGAFLGLWVPGPRDSKTPSSFIEDISIHMHIYVCMYVYIYIYRYKYRSIVDRSIDRFLQ